MSLPPTWAFHRHFWNMPHRLFLPTPTPPHNRSNSDLILRFYQINLKCAKSQNYINNSISFYPYEDLFRLINFQIFSGHLDSFTKGPFFTFEVFLLKMRLNFIVFVRHLNDAKIPYTRIKMGHKRVIKINL